MIANGVDLQPHLYALEASGHTLIPSQVDADGIAELRLVAERALVGVRAAIERGERVPLQPGTQHYEAANCLYRFGGAASALLEHAAVGALADAILGEYRLNDLTVFSALPARSRVDSVETTSWHRDCPLAREAPGHLWFFFLLDDFTTENGATWIVPGSHRAPLLQEPELEGPWVALDLARFPSARQVLGCAGDLIVIDARALHTSGVNRTMQPRRMINLGLVHESHRARVRTDHWTAAGPEIRTHAGERLRRLLGADPDPITTR
jgi:ectoine hydroxylase-related dioxygenase (phytanoyl-CoA dioxygenase family)